jgi:hypothetical protein
MLCAVIPRIEADGTVSSINGCIMDITSDKAAEGEARRRAEGERLRLEEAIEAKRQQEK